MRPCAITVMRTNNIAICQDHEHSRNNRSAVDDMPTNVGGSIMGQMQNQLQRNDDEQQQ